MSNLKNSAVQFISLLVLVGCGGQSFTAFSSVDETADSGADSAKLENASGGSAGTDVDSGGAAGGSETTDAGDTGGATGSTGGERSTGGVTSTGGTIGSTGGVLETGGTKGTGGTPETGGVKGTGGVTGSGGTTSTGGTTGTGGAPAAMCCKFALVTGTTVRTCDTSTAWYCTGGQTFACGQEGLCTAGLTCYQSAGPYGGVVEPCP